MCAAMHRDGGAELAQLQGATIDAIAEQMHVGEISEDCIVYTWKFVPSARWPYGGWYTRTWNHSSGRMSPQRSLIEAMDQQAEERGQLIGRPRIYHLRFRSWRSSQVMAIQNILNHYGFGVVDFGTDGTIDVCTLLLSGPEARAIITEIGDRAEVVAVMASTIGESPFTAQQENSWWAGLGHQRVDTAQQDTARWRAPAGIDDALQRAIIAQLREELRAEKAKIERIREGAVPTFIQRAAYLETAVGLQRESVAQYSAKASQNVLDRLETELRAVNCVLENVKTSVPDEEEI